MGNLPEKARPASISKTPELAHEPQSFETNSRCPVFQCREKVTGKTYTEENALLFSAKDAAVPAALLAYVEECKRLGTNPEHIESVFLLHDRVLKFQASIGNKVPDTVGQEIPRCLRGEGILSEPHRMCDSPLYVAIEDEQLVIRIGVKRLADCSTGDDLGALRGRKITDPVEFCEDVIKEMMIEDEAGETPLIRFLGEMEKSAFESGSLAVEF